MMLLTVILSTLAITTAIRVPPVWPEQEARIADLKVAQNTYYNHDDLGNSENYNNPPTEADLRQANNQGFYTPKLEHQTTDVAYTAPYAQNKRRPSGSHTEFAVINGKTKQGLIQNYNIREPDVRYSVQHSHKRTPTVLHVTLATKNNRDNKGDYNQNIKYNQPNTKTRHNNPENFSFSQPVIYVNHNADFPTAADGWMPIINQQSPHKAQEFNSAYVHRNPDSKHNQIQDKIANRRHSPPINHRRQYKNYNDRADSASAVIYHPESLRHQVTSKNYRDDKTHEPSDNDEVSEIQDPSDDLEDDDAEEIPASTFEAQKDVPTKPIYPGEGKWAIRGLKHRPFVSNHNYTNLEDDSEDQPEGYETFANAAPSFEKQHSRFNANLQSFPQRHELGEYIDAKREENQHHEDQKEDVEEEHEVDEEEDDGFVPTRLQAQVRKTESEEHLPSSLTDARLREVIKDSKIHTVYTEEGYEDTAYDHEGHEKEAEEGEGHAEFDKDALKQKRKYPKSKNIGFDEVDVLKEFENYDDPNKNDGKIQPAADFETSASSYEEPNQNNNLNKNKFATTNENKTTEVKNMDDGDQELEITSEIKIMTQPNNVSTAHKFVKIVPKYKNKVNLKRSVKPSVILQRRKRYVNDLPKIEVNKDYLDVLNNEKRKALPIVTTEKYPYYKIRNSEILNKNSPLRYAEDMRNIPQKIPGRMSFYEQSGASECPEIPRNVNPIPDRIEKLENKAKEGENAEESGGFAGLPDVPRLKNLGDKIDCLKSKFFGENPLDSPIFQEDIVEPPEPIFKELASLNNLDKINNKGNLNIVPRFSNTRKYVDKELPTDSEEREQFEEDGEQAEETYSASDIKEDYEENNADYATLDQEAFPQTPKKSTLNTTHPAGSALNPPENNVSTTSETNAVVKTNFRPRHIYDQIDLAENLDNVNLIPNFNENVQNSGPPNLNVNRNTSQAPSQSHLITTSEKPILSTIDTNSNTVTPPLHQSQHLNSSGTVTNKSNSNPVANEVDAQTLLQINGLSETSEETSEVVNDRQPKALLLSMETNTQNTNMTKQSNLADLQHVTTRKMDTEEALPESAALRILRKRRRRPQMPIMHVFDVNKFLPTPLPPLITYPTTNTVLPKYKTLSEVYYKDEIQPNEQLNVFADVINNIKNSPSETLVAEGSEYSGVIEDTRKDFNLLKNNSRKVKVPPRKVRIKHADTTNYRNSLNERTSTTTTTTTTTSPRPRRKNKYKNHKPNAQIYEEYVTTIKENQATIHNAGSRYKDSKKVPQGTQITRTPQKKKSPQVSVFEDSYISGDTSYSKPAINEDLVSEAAVDDVLGLAPPYSLAYPSVYKTVNNHNPTLDHSLTELNTFLVPGMKPPGTQKPVLYSDFKLLQHNRIRRRNNYHRIHKRSPYKPSYSEIKRSRPQSASEEKEEEEEEDDYVPNRNRNFRYDVENDKVVYTKKQEEVEEPPPEPQEEVVEEEDEKEYLTLVKVEPPKPFVVITTEKNGPSFLDYVQQLKSNNEYRVILDPQPTKKPGEESSTSDSKGAESTTKKAESIIPEFLSVVAKLKSNENYKEIKDKKPKSTTTASPPEEEEEEVEAEEIEEPEVEEYLPRPRTVIDYSKYKTIERTPVARRHNYSSRYSSEDDDLPLNNRDSTQVPISAASDRNEDNIQVSSSEQRFENSRNSEGGTRRSGYSSSEEVEEEVVRPTTTETPETTTTQPRKLRIRGRKRPTTTTTTPRPTTTVSTTRRMRRTRPTTTAEPALEENYSQTQRVIRRKLPERFSRQNQKVPPNHKAFYTPIVADEDTAADSKRLVVQRKRKVSRLVTPEHTQLPRNSNSSNQVIVGKPGEIQPRKLPDVHVFRKYDHNKRHGGNYRRADETRNPQAVETNSVPPTAYEIEDSKEIRRLSDIVPKPFAFYSDPTLPKSINQLTEPKATASTPTESEESGTTATVQERNDKDYHEEYVDEVRINFNKNSETANKKPVYIVKDPSKRLYFYAPVK